MNDALLQQFVQLISDNLGLYIREQDREALQEKLCTRMKWLKLSDPEEYYQFLNLSADQDSCFNRTLNLRKNLISNQAAAEALRDREWEELTRLLTIGESYFFRDQGQFQLLEHQILPALIEQRKSAARAAGNPRSSLRIWSAGCSTGEEAYSLAILVDQLLPDPDHWNLHILGTDINPSSIEKAKRGVYNSWSFRAVENHLRLRYFYQQNVDWQLHETIRKMVKFQTSNLLKDNFPSKALDIQNIDLIVCRNVFIYFSASTIARILEKFYQTLRMGGYLVTGHAELYGQNLGQFQTKLFPESLVYQRSAHEPAKTALAPSDTLSFYNEKSSCYIDIAQTSCISMGTDQVEERSPLATGLSLSTGSKPRAISTNQVTDQIVASSDKSALLKTTQAILNQAEMFFRRGEYAIAIETVKPALQQEAYQFDAYFLMARSYANLGEYEQASYYCQESLTTSFSSMAPYYLLAHLAEEQGNSEEAKSHLKKIIYLAPGSIPAYLELGALYEKAGDIVRAKKMRTTALELLQELPPNTAVNRFEFDDKWVAGDLLSHVKQILHYKR